MSELTGQKMREALLKVINEYSKGIPASFQSGSILSEVVKRLEIRNNTSMEQALLTIWHDLFREGHLAWGYNLDNLNPPFCHITEQGRKTLENISRDPANPDGYIAHLKKQCSLNDIAESYITEALKTYNANCIKATAVMVGCAAESLILELRDELLVKMKNLKKIVPKNLTDWKIKSVLKNLQQEIDIQKGTMALELREKFESYFPAFIQQIRTIRNDSGHPVSVQPVTQESVHSALLIFPELAELKGELKEWISNNYS
jgi:hypothetical protein